MTISLVKVTWGQFYYHWFNNNNFKSDHRFSHFKVVRYKYECKIKADLKGTFKSAEYPKITKLTSIIIIHVYDGACLQTVMEMQTQYKKAGILPVSEEW